MCEKCTELDKVIEHHKSLAVYVRDQAVLDALDFLIARALAEKAKLHPEK